MLDAATLHDAPARPARLPMEHRWGERVPCGTRVTLRLNGGTRAGTMRDVSMSGAFVELDAPPRALVPLTLVVSAADAGRGAGIEIDAVVVRVAPDGVGIEWCDLPRGSFCTLLGCAQRCKAPADTPCPRTHD